FSKPRPGLPFSENHKIITMHNFNSLQLAGADLRGLEGADSARELSAVQVADPDDLPGLKLAFAAGDARRQEALAALAQRFLCAAIHEQRAFGMMEECDPTLSPPQSCWLRHKQCAFVLAAEHAGQHGLFPAGGDDQWNTGA